MKKKTPAYEQIRLIMQDMRFTAQDVAAFDEDIATNLLSQISGVESWLDEIEGSYKKAAKKSAGPMKKSQKRVAAARKNLKKAAKALSALTAEERKNRAKKAAAARWKKHSS